MIDLYNYPTNCDHAFSPASQIEWKSCAKTPASLGFLQALHCCQAGFTSNHLYAGWWEKVQRLLQQAPDRLAAISLLRLGRAAIWRDRPCSLCKENIHLLCIQYLLVCFLILFISKEFGFVLKNLSLPEVCLYICTLTFLFLDSVFRFITRPQTLITLPLKRYQNSSGKSNCFCFYCHLSFNTAASKSHCSLSW